MALKGKIEAIIYAAEDPVTLDQIAFLLKDEVLQEVAEEQAGTAELESSEQTASVPQSEAALPEDSGSGAAFEVVSDPSTLVHGSSPNADGRTQPEAISSDTEAAAPTGEAESMGPVAVAAPSLVASEPLVTGSSVNPEETSAEASQSAPTLAPKKRKKVEIPPEVKQKIRLVLQELVSDYANPDRGMEIRQIAGGYRMATKPEHHDVIKAFARSLKPPFRLSLPALETLAVVAYKQPITAPEVSEIRGVDSQGVIATLLDRKLVTTAGRKAVIGRPILYKTTKEFLLRFGLRDLNELPSMEEFEKLAQDAGQVDMFVEDEGEEVPPVEAELSKAGAPPSEAQPSDIQPSNDEQVGEAETPEPPSSEHEPQQRPATDPDNESDPKDSEQPEAQ